MKQCAIIGVLAVAQTMIITTGGIDISGGAICLSARLVRLALVPPTAVNVTGISRARGIDARRAGARAMPNRTCSLEHPKDEHEKQRHSVRKRGKKRCRKSPRGHFFP